MLGTSNLDPGGFGAAFWAADYRTVRTANVLLASLPSSTALTDPEKETARGIVNTIKALELFTIWMAHDTAGIVIKVDGPPQDPAPILCRDPAINDIAALLDSAQAQITAGVVSGFPFTALPAGFANFNNKTTFLTFNRAWKAKVNVYSSAVSVGVDGAVAVVHRHGQRAHAHAGACGARSWSVHVFSSAAGDALSTLFAALDRHTCARTRAWRTGAETGPNGINARYTAKVTTTTTASDQGVSSNLGFIVFPTNTSSMPIIRNEELILLRAQANHGLGNLDAAGRDLNFIRTRSGNWRRRRMRRSPTCWTISCTTSATRCCTRRARAGWTCGSTTGWISSEGSADAQGARELSGTVERGARTWWAGSLHSTVIR